ncbi:hypothetical protein CEXT_781521 [Caerostris extrusa]|uniref:Uncharacterized protein n=1 Tax=Caerostris extrusa TaxID=172846 RepID=A0AAV4T064_CAEEX|nr:hypothetical protein CEXT_781521 [Caerostris extrusa]
MSSGSFLYFLFSKILKSLASIPGRPYTSPSAMSGMWLLVFLIIQAGNLIRVLNGSFHGSARSDEPTCEELRTFWNAVSQSMRMNEFTNEIPHTV